MSDGDKNDAPDVFEIERIKRLVELMEEHDLSEVDLQQDNERIKLKRGGVAASPPLAASVPSAPIAAQPVPTASTENPNIVTVDAPMVGTFYSRANPDSEPFVKVGSMVSPDTVICIVEAMKVFNEIPAEVSGKVVEILAKDQEPVEFGKPLFKIDTSA